MKKLNLLNFGHAGRWIGLVLAAVSLLAGTFAYLSAVRQEPAWQYACNIRAFEVVTEECLESVEIPVNRRFEAVTDEAAVLGLWTTHPVGEGELVHPSQLTATSPDRFRFDPSGEPLPEEVWGYYIPVTGEVLEKIAPGNMLTMAMIDPLTEQAIVVLDKVRLLEKGGAGVYVGATMEQIAALEGLNSEIMPAEGEGEADTQAPRLVWTITQGANPDLPVLAVFSTALDPTALEGRGERE